MVNRINTVKGQAVTGLNRKTPAETIPEEAKRAGRIRRAIEDIRDAAHLEREFARDEFNFTRR